MVSYKAGTICLINTNVTLWLNESKNHGKELQTVGQLLPGDVVFILRGNESEGLPSHRKEVYVLTKAGLGWTCAAFLRLLEGE